MTRDEVELRLEELGFELRMDYPDSPDPYTWIYLNDEMVGDLSSSRMEIANEVPSLVGKTWVSVKRRYFKYSEIANMNVLNRITRELLESRRWFEESLRQERVQNVREYFKNKKLRKMGATRA